MMGFEKVIDTVQKQLYTSELVMDSAGHLDPKVLVSIEFHFSSAATATTLTNC